MPSFEGIGYGDVVFIKWHDSSHLPGWQSPPILLDLGFIESAGIVVEVSEGSIIITSAMNEAGATLTPLAIPRSCISEIRKLEHEIVPETTCRQAC